MANTKESMDDQAFSKFMEKVLGELTSVRPKFASVKVSVGENEGDGYAGKIDSNCGSDCSLCAGGFPKVAYKEGWDGSLGDVNGDEDSPSTTSATITFRITGPEGFTEEIAEDVRGMLLDFRGDALSYARGKFGEDAADLVSVGVDFSSSTI